MQDKTKTDSTADSLKTAATGPGKVSEKDHETKGQSFRAGATDEGVVVNDNIGGSASNGADAGRNKTTK